MVLRLSRRSTLAAGVLISLAWTLPLYSAPPAAGERSPGRPAAEVPKQNRLGAETSPYLLMHAHNPVDWYPWGPEAFDKARREAKVIFLSVGYSSCHWCHVMERESFMDPEIAEFLNENFVSIKVDREERPDVDAVYMKAVQIFSQINGGPARGGWPMTAFLTPDKQPFFAGTYYPARDGDRGATTGFLTIVRRVQDLWKTRGEDLRRDANTLTQLVRRELDGRPTTTRLTLDGSVADKAVSSLEERFDPKYGGFGFSAANPRQPKFPEPSNLLFLIQRVQADGTSADDKRKAREMLVNTLERMSMGGIRDHLGGGFHRYSVDRYWKIPHFEKMLYDNAQLATVYAEAHRLTGRDDFRRVTTELLDFVLREMTDANGGFYSALDADSEHEEGKFYRWEKESVRSLLTPAEFDLWAAVYGFNDPPNFEEEYFVPQLSQPLAEIATQRSLTESELEERLAPLRRELLEARNQRTRPLTDTKILTSWNGLMIRGFADAGRILDRDDYLQAAARAADFVLSRLREENGRLLRTFGGGTARLNAYLDDYAFVVDGLLSLHRASGDGRWLEAAAELTERQIELYWDDDHGGFYFTSDDHESLIARGRDPIDGAQPSGNSVAADNLVALAELLQRPEYLALAERTIQSAGGLLDAAPAAAPRLALAAEKWRSSSGSPAGAAADEEEEGDER